MKAPSSCTARPSSNRSVREGGRNAWALAVIRPPCSFRPTSHISESRGSVSTRHDRLLELVRCVHEIVTETADVGHGAAIGGEAEIERVHVALHGDVDRK